MPPVRDADPIPAGTKAGDVVDRLRPRFGWPSAPVVDVSWRNVVFSLRTAAAAILALAVAYTLDIGEPQWATLTVYLLAQPTVGGAVAKGVWRAAGTVVGGILGLVIVALFSQSPELLVAATVLVFGASFYAGARLRNFASHGALMCGYTTLLIAYEGALDPLGAWTIAADRIAAILIGIGSGALASIAILPRYAGDMLREGLRTAFVDLSAYVATALRMSAPPQVFARLRADMVRGIVSFDALRSYAVFETPDMRSNAGSLERIVREFLMVLSVARGLFVRLDAFDGPGAKSVGERLRTTLRSISRGVEAAAADPGIWTGDARLRDRLRDAHRELDQTAADLEGMAGTAPFDQLANGVLVVNRVGDLLDRLAMVVVAESVALRGGGKRTGPRPALPLDGRPEALLLAIRACVSIALLSILWMATGWNEGFTAVSGGVITLLLSVNQDNQQAAARTFLVWTAAGILLAYVTMILVLPHIEGFAALGVVLMVMLLVPGLMAGTPSHALAGTAFGAFAISEISTGNRFQPNEIAFVNGAAALLIGLVICLVVIAAVPVTSMARRDRSWRRTIGQILPSVARGAMPPRKGVAEIVATLTALLPRLSPDRQREEDFLRGTLGAASSAIELGRLVALASDADLPREAGLAVDRFLGRFAGALETLAAERGDRRTAVAEAETAVADARAALAELPLTPGPAARSVLRAGASLRFLADRFDIDRAYLERAFDDD